MAPPRHLETDGDDDDDDEGDHQHQSAPSVVLRPAANFASVNDNRCGGRREEGGGLMLVTEANWVDDD